MTEMQEQERCGRELSTSYKSHLAGIRCWKRSPRPSAKVKRKMDQAQQVVEADLSVLLSQAVTKSSDDIGWQNVRAIHFGDTFKDLPFRASDEHCAALNLA